MADHTLKRVLDAGIHFTAMTQAKAEEIVKELVSAGEVQTEQAQSAVSDLLDRSRQATESLIETVRKEVADQITSLGLVGQTEIARLEARLEALVGARPAGRGGRPRPSGPPPRGRRRRRPRPRRRRRRRRPPRRPPPRRRRRRRPPRRRPPRRRPPPRRPRPRRRPQPGRPRPRRRLRPRGPRPPRRPDALRRPLDRELVRRGLLPDLDAARDAVASGTVVVSGSPTTNPTRLVDAGEPLRVLGPPPPYVSRAGEKLRAALDHFAVDPAGLRAVDVGASTGGFTDCLLQGGATHVVAVDVGRGQLHERLRADPRVESRERTDVRRLTPDDVGGPADLLSVDVAFVALRTVLPAVVGLARPGAHLLLLVKPQFEADAADVAKGRGVVRDPAVWSIALGRVVDALDRLGAAIMGGMVSPLRGADGNVEFVLHALAPGGDASAGAPLDVEALVAAATDVTER